MVEMVTGRERVSLSRSKVESLLPKLPGIAGEEIAQFTASAQLLLTRLKPFPEQRVCIHRGIAAGCSQRLHDVFSRKQGGNRASGEVSAVQPRCSLRIKHGRV